MGVPFANRIACPPVGTATRLERLLAYECYYAILRPIQALETAN